MLKRAVQSLSLESPKDKEKVESRSSSHTASTSSTKNGGTESDTVSKEKFRLSSFLRPSPRSSYNSASASSETSTETKRTNSKRLQKMEEKEKKAVEREKYQNGIAIRRLESEVRASKIETPEQRARYGIEYPHDWNERHNEWNSVSSVGQETHIGDTVIVRARIHTIRDVSSHLVFLVLRQQIFTIQAVLAEEPGEITGHMVRWAKRLPLESIVLVRGKLQAPREPITGASVSHAEIKVHDLFLVSENKEPLPFNVYDADLVLKSKDDDDSESHASEGDSLSRDENQHMEAGRNDAPVVSQRVRLANRIIDLRTPTAQAIFRINAAICSHFRRFLDGQAFIEVHTPKILGGASESGSSVFQLDYFGRPAFLAQSPQLFKQMCIAADFKKVYEIGPVFRAENSNTARHLTEYTGLDLEMEVVHYYDALKLIDEMLKTIFRALQDNFKAERELIKRHYPHKDLVFPQETLILPFAQGIRMLVESGYLEEDGSIPKEDQDLHTRAEIRLGELVKQKFNTDYYILDKFPSSVRPFYAMDDAENPLVTNSFDIFLRGQEICTGGQRIHHIDGLEKKMQKLQISPKGMQEYLEGFRLGAPPHAGCGIGLERLVMLYLNLGDIRIGSLFYRDPKSLPMPKNVEKLRHPEASTNPPPWKSAKFSADAADPESSLRDMQPPEKLIANYGDASNTAWLDERYKVWRDAETGAAVGYSAFKGYAMIIGDPLCDRSQYNPVSNRFLGFIKKEAKLKPIWLMVNSDMEEILGGRLDWCTLSVAAEERVYDTSNNQARHDADVTKKIRHAKKEGTKIQDYSLVDKVPQDVMDEVDERIQDWKQNRKGEQVHMTLIQPWKDMDHRIYYIARDGSGKVCALVVLHQLSPEHGYQIKWALDFPGAPSGSIEYIIIHAMDANPRTQMTFGASATSKLVAKHGLGKLTVKALSKAYSAIAEHNRLTNKGEFRQKLGAVEDRVYVCYPRHGLSPAGIKAIVEFFKQ